MMTRLTGMRKKFINVDRHESGSIRALSAPMQGQKMPMQASKIRKAAKLRQNN